MKKWKRYENDRAVSSVVGIIILLLITLLSISIIILYTIPTIDDMQDLAKAQKIEQAFTVADSRASKASLGESPLQTTRVSLMGGTLEVRGDAEAYNESQIMILAVSSSSSWYDDFLNKSDQWNSWKDYENESDFSGYSSTIPMGKIIYTTGDRTIAYEGGGVWSRYGDGGSVMISPPEFHFNTQTLTLPIMKITGNTSISGTTETDIMVRSTNTPQVLFPNTTIDINFTNPIRADDLFIYINSEFYDGWAKYAETLTASEVTLDHQNQTTIIQLGTVPPMGTFPLSSSFKIIKLNESNPDPMYNFSFYFEDTEGDASNFNPVRTYITATAGTKTLYYEIKKNEITTIEYTDSSYGTNKEKWATSGGSEFPIYEDPLHVKMANSTFDLLSTTYMLEYDNQADAEFSWDEVSSTTMLPNVSITTGDVYPLYNVTNHYMKLLASDGLIVCSWSQNNNEKIKEEDSEYTLVYDSSGNIAYLHITSSDLEASVV
ncbi:DUF7289 family protein [Methanolobus profundi]|nr:hypothetical protein [Methanolobus profundi]